VIGPGERGERPGKRAIATARLIERLRFRAALSERSWIGVSVISP